jgi:WD40 repeat protein
VTHIESGYSALSGCTETIASYDPCPSGYVEAYLPDGGPINLQPAGLANWPRGLTFNPDGTQLAVTTCQTTNGYDCPASDIWIWSLPGGELKKVSAPIVRPAGFQFSFDSRYLAFGGEGTDVMLIDLNDNGVIRLPLLDLPGQIASLAFNPDGSMLAGSGSFEDPGPYANTIYHGRIVVWDTETGQVVAHGDLPGSTAGELAFSADGQLLSYILQEGDEYPFQILPVGLGLWQETACRIANRDLTETEWQRYVIGEDFRPICP